MNGHRRSKRQPSALSAALPYVLLRLHPRLWQDISWRQSRMPSGLTLLEMLIALVVGTIVLIGLAGVAGPFLRQAGQATIDADRQHQMQHALAWITRTIEQAGWCVPGPDGEGSIKLVIPDSGHVRHFYAQDGTLWLEEQGQTTRIVDDVQRVSFFPQVDMVRLVIEMGNGDYQIERTTTRAMRNLQFIADWRFNDMSGDVIFDNSPFNHNGAIYHGNWIAGPDGGGALSFDGSSTFVEIPYTVRLALTDRMAIIADVLITSASGQQTIFHQGNVPGTPGADLYLDDDRVVYAYRSGGSMVSIASPSLTWSAGRWYRIMVQHDDVEQAVRLYRDDMEIQAATAVGVSDKGSLHTGNGQIYLGARQGQADYLHGALGRVSVIRF